jgi:hypothetical protein
MDHPGARFILQPNGIFHPKIYLFENDQDDWACIVGSPNFTRAAFSKNMEAAVWFDSKSPDARATYGQLRSTIDKQWGSGKRLAQVQLERYRSAWKQAGRLRNLAEMRGKPPVEIELSGLSWQEFVSRVKSEKHHSLADRLRVLNAVREYFVNSRFGEMDLGKRLRIAGVAPQESGPTGLLNWGFFGYMGVAGRFVGSVKRNDQNLSAGLDCIPVDGLVAEDDYLAFIEFFQKAFPQGGGGLAVATRLLCMKRPDTFICIDKKNRAKLCEDFGIAWSNMDHERYWSEIIERVRLMKWWNAPRPAGKEDEEIWLGRTALLDALYYEQ